MKQLKRVFKFIKWCWCDQLTSENRGWLIFLFAFATMVIGSAWSVFTGNGNAFTVAFITVTFVLTIQFSILMWKKCRTNWQTWVKFERQEKQKLMNHLSGKPHID